MRTPLRHEIIMTDVSLRQCSVRTVNRIEGFPIDQNASTQRVPISKALSLSFLLLSASYTRCTANRDIAHVLPHRNAPQRRIVCPQHVRQPVSRQKPPDRALSLHRTPARALLQHSRGIRPQQIQHQLARLQISRFPRFCLHRILGGVEGRGNPADLGDGAGRAIAVRPRNAAVHAEQNVVDNRGKRKTVEDLVGAIPQLRAIAWKRGNRTVRARSSGKRERSWERNDDEEPLY